MKKVELYTDGACSGNPGVGGYGAILIFKGIEKEISGGFYETTNNRMEIFAVVQGLRTLKEACDVTVYSDSALLVNSINKGWLKNWQSNDWKTADKKDVKNKDLWTALIFEMNRHKVSFVKVEGHADNKYNNRCDELAVEETKKLKNKTNE